MIRSTILGRCFAMGHRTTYSKMAQTWKSLRRPFSSSSDGVDGPEDLEVIEDDVETSARNKSKPSEYQFFGKNIAVVVENPLFPFNNKIVHLGKYHSKLLNTKMPLFVTCVLRKEIEDSAVQKDTNQSGSMVGRDVTKDFYSLGTYCSVEYNKDSPHKIVCIYMN